MVAVEEARCVQMRRPQNSPCVNKMTHNSRGGDHLHSRKVAGLKVSAKGLQPAPLGFSGFIANIVVLGSEARGFSLAREYASDQASEKMWSRAIIWICGEE